MWICDCVHMYVSVCGSARALVSVHACMCRHEHAEDAQTCMSEAQSRDHSTEIPLFPNASVL